MIAFLLIFAPLTGVPFASATEVAAVPALVRQYCADCHDSDIQKGGLDLDSIREDELGRHAEVWENVIRKLRTRQMPPPDKKRPDERAYEQMISHLASSLDAVSMEKPNPGRTEALRRLNRTEYRNAIRDLLELEMDAGMLLPKEDASHGFDNVTVGGLSPTLLERYISAAQKISRLAIGRPSRSEGGVTFRIPADVTQEDHVPGLPLGTRGGTVISHSFPRDAVYEIQVRLARDRNEEVEGLREEHEMVVLLDREEVKSFTIAPPRGHRNFELVDQHLKVRLPVTAGPRIVGVTFLKKGSSLFETKRQPYAARFNMHRHPRASPAVYQISINGPYDATGPGDTPSRARIFVSRPDTPEQDESRAEEILSILTRRAYRRPVTAEDLEGPMAFYREGYLEDGFEAGLEEALSAILVSPEFLFRIEQEPEGMPPGGAYRISDLELASRLSFFLWSSIPDDALLEAAVRGDLSKPALLEKETRRMLADPRSRALADNFAGQWLHLRNLESFNPDLRLFPDFDDNLRQSFRQETELLFDSMVREDRSVLDLLKADYTFLNERLAKHYGIPHVYGSRFRRVPLPEESRRGGVLRHGSILSVTSYATRTSPVIRGDWILQNILGTPTPPPPADVPDLDDNTVSAMLSGRERLAEHRANPACASCHNLMDPIGFALENFDAVGRWRTMEAGRPVDASGGLPDGSTFEGVRGLEQALLNRPELFVGTVTEKLMTFAQGRGMEYYDAPAVRQVVREAQADAYKFSSIIIGIVNSTPFQMRKSL
jgi:mono/diheme cytochrome c family protein